MSIFNAITPTTVGVDFRTNPLFLGNKRLAGAVNVEFDEGVIRTRPGFVYRTLGLSGQFQGAYEYLPGRGLSAEPFAVDRASLILAVDGKIYVNESSSGNPSCKSWEICGDYNFKCKGDVHIYQAENWLVIQNEKSNTYFWPGYGCLTASPGLADCVEIDDPVCPTASVFDKCVDGGACAPPETPEPEFNSLGQQIPRPTPDLCQEQDTGIVVNKTLPPIAGGAECSETAESSHDSFCSTKHKNWLVNSAGLGIYVHGRIHQQCGRAIFVSDMVHKRGYLATDDVLKMEEQVLPSYGDPLTTNSKLGELVALAVLPSMSTANGEGDLVGYYENGVVAYNTFQFPRESRIDGEGQFITQGWDTKRMVSHVLNTVSATGRYAVATLPRDHMFRSIYGIHFLNFARGSEVFNDESLNTVSSDVATILDADTADNLFGVSCGHWVYGSRMVCTTGMERNESISSTSFGRGFVVWNQSVGYAERRPIPAWDGLWLPHSGIKAVHHFMNLGIGSVRSFGFLCSDEDCELMFATVTKGLEEDVVENCAIPIEWSVTTAKLALNGLDQLKVVTDGRLEGLFKSSSHKVRVMIRTDVSSKWATWREFSPCDKIKSRGQIIRHSEVLGQPPIQYREATWFQLRVDGLGSAELTGLDLDFSAVSGKGNRTSCVVVDKATDDPFEINSSPPESRWKSM